jgi:hypothetical protein
MIDWQGSYRWQLPFSACLLPKEVVNAILHFPDCLSLFSMINTRADRLRQLGKSRS